LWIRLPAFLALALLEDAHVQPLHHSANKEAKVLLAQELAGVSVVVAAPGVRATTVFRIPLNPM